MVTPTIRQAAKKAGIKTAYELHQRAGFSLSLAYALWSNKGEKIAYATINTLCHVFNCEVGDLMRRTKD